MYILFHTRYQNMHPNFMVFMLGFNKNLLLDTLWLSYNCKYLNKKYSTFSIKKERAQGIFLIVLVINKLILHLSFNIKRLYCQFFSIFKNLSLSVYGRESEFAPAVLVLWMSQCWGSISETTLKGDAGPFNGPWGINTGKWKKNKGHRDREEIKDPLLWRRKKNTPKRGSDKVQWLICAGVEVLRREKDRTIFPGSDAERSWSLVLL